MKADKSDPLMEEKYSPLPGLIHKYSNRVLVIITSKCAEYCDFCTRKRIRGSDFEISEQQLIAIKKYLVKNKKIKEVIFSGGDPLMAPEPLIKALDVLGKVKSVKIIRIHTKIPVVRPQLVNRKIINTLSAESAKPLYLCLHINHPKEINSLSIAAVERLRKAGVILLSQTVFIKGLNDSVSVLERLFSQLIELGIKPYYLFHCDPVCGNKKYIVSINKEIKIVSELRRRLSGLAFPMHAIDAPAGLGKVLAPTDYWNFNSSFFRDFSGKKIRIA